MPSSLPSFIPPQPSISHELEALRSLGDWGQPALPALALLPDLYA